MENPRGLLLVVDDDPDVAELIGLWMGREGFRVDHVGTRHGLFETLTVVVPDVVLLDLGLPDGKGLAVLAELRDRFPFVPVVIVTATREVDVVVEAMRSGALDYVAKPFDKQRLITAVAAAQERGALHTRVRHLEEQLAHGSYHGIVGRSRVMERLFRELDHVTGADVSVLIHGESGTGKELVARALHTVGKRASGAFVPINCAAIPENLVESELFGHERGAFTGAVAQHKGSVERAAGGTLFLDEVAELPLSAQGKLLRVLQERSFRRVGGSTELRSDFRLVAASHQDLRELVRTGRFREDLYYRMAVFELELPPLRARDGDVCLIARQLLRELSPNRAMHLSDAAAGLLDAYAWPGNIRELRNAMERAVVLCRDSAILPEHLPPVVCRPALPPTPVSIETPAPILDIQRASVPNPLRGGTMEDLEKDALIATLERHGGNVSAAVRELGIGRTTLYRKMKKFGLM